MSTLVSPEIPSSLFLGFRVTPRSLSPVLALSLILTCGALVPRVARAQTYTLSTLATFTGTANGANPLAVLTLDSRGNLYGTTEYGGANGDGTVFEIAAGTNTINTLATFNYNYGDIYGSFLFTGVTLDNSGNIYGTTAFLGGSGYGTVFKVASGTNTLTALATFDKADGAQPRGSVTLDSNGNVYGTTFVGGANNAGTVFKIASGTNTLTTLANFNTINGQEPSGNLVLDSSGNLYGTTEYGGANGDGTVFEIAAGTNALTTLATFNGINGANPYGGLTFDSSGNLYGTAANGGAGGDGTVFKLTLTGAASASEPSELMLLLASSIPGTLGLSVARRRRKTANGCSC